MKKYLLVAAVLVCFLGACSSTESPEMPKKHANLEMRLETDPIVITDWYYSNALIISETNGVGGHITTAELAWIWNDQVYLTNNFEGRQFRAFDSWRVQHGFWVDYTYDKVRITLAGTDDNGFRFNFKREWPLYYQ